jgi:hypothetical protein
MLTIIEVEIWMIKILKREERRQVGCQVNEGELSSQIVTLLCFHCRIPTYLMDNLRSACCVDGARRRETTAYAPRVSHSKCGRSQPTATLGGTSQAELMELSIDVINKETTTSCLSVLFT